MSSQAPLIDRLEDAEKRASKLAHDLNNLISVMLGYAALLVDLTPADSPARRMADEVQQAADRAAEMSRQLLEVRREQRALEAELRDAVGAPGAAAAADVDAAPAKAERSRKKAGPGTVLVVEDDPSVRRLAESILKRGGYHVLMAAESSQAIKLCHEHDGAIDLLLTDVVLPGDSGSDLVAKALKVRPKMLVLYMSGYSPDGLPGGGPFLPKPFTAEALLARVKALLADAAR